MLPITTTATLAKSHISDLSTWDWESAPNNVDILSHSWTVTDSMGLTIPPLFTGRSAVLIGFLPKNVDVFRGQFVRIRTVAETLNPALRETLFTGTIEDYTRESFGDDYRYVFECQGLLGRASRTPEHLSSGLRMFSMDYVVEEAIDETETAVSLSVGDTPIANGLFDGLSSVLRRPNTPNVGSVDYFEGSTTVVGLKTVSADGLLPYAIAEMGDGSITVLDCLTLLENSPSDDDITTYSPQKDYIQSRVNRINAHGLAAENEIDYSEVSPSGNIIQSNSPLVEGWNLMTEIEIGLGSRSTSVQANSRKWDYAELINSGYIGFALRVDNHADRFTEKSVLVYANESGRISAGDNRDWQFYQTNLSTGRDPANLQEYEYEDASGAENDAGLSLPPGTYTRSYDRTVPLIPKMSWDTFVSKAYTYGVDRISFEVWANKDEATYANVLADLSPATQIKVEGYTDRLAVKEVQWVKENNGLMYVRVIADTDYAFTTL